MARAKRKTKTTAAKRKNAVTRRAAPKDAVALLKADHREVAGWFEQFEKTGSDAKKSDLAAKICKALTVHATIEEEIFYPAFLEATEDKDMHHEAEIEHDGAKKLIAEIQSSGPDDDYFDSKVHVLSEMIKHHVKEEEQRGGMFAEARQSDMDLVSLGEQLASRKAELMGQGAPRTNGRAVKRGAAERFMERVRG